VTSLMERLTGPRDDELDEETRVTNPPSFTLPRGVPWWAGVYGLDPAMTAEAVALPGDDWALAAQCTAMACAACVFGAGAGYPVKLLSRKGAPARQWLDWLLDAPGPEDAACRRLALRLTCERTQAADAAAVLEDAQHLHDACSARRR
jgi:hypothetical protein